MDYLLVDGMNFAYRAHNAFFQNKTSDGTPSGMFYGVCVMLQTLKKKHRNYKIVFVWDNKAEWKYEINPSYKEGRTKMSPLVYNQMEDIRSYLTACNVEQYEMKGQEADDVIATLVERYKAEENTGSIIILSNDRDLLQLVESGKVTVFKPKVGNTPEKYYDTDAVIERYGVPPEKLVEFRCIAGDDSDKIPGVPRNRRNLIAACVSEASNLEESFVLFKDSDMSEKEKERLVIFKSQAFENYKIMKLCRDLKEVERTEVRPDVSLMGELLAKYEIKRIKPDLMYGLFMSSLNLKYTDAKPAYKLESFSLFEE